MSDAQAHYGEPRPQSLTSACPCCHREVTSFNRLGDSHGWTTIYRHGSIEQCVLQEKRQADADAREVEVADTSDTPDLAGREPHDGTRPRRISDDELTEVLFQMRDLRSSRNLHLLATRASNMATEIRRLQDLLLDLAGMTRLLCPYCLGERVDEASFQHTAGCPGRALETEVTAIRAERAQAPKP